MRLIHTVWFVDDSKCPDAFDTSHLASGKTRSAAADFYDDLLAMAFDSQVDAYYVMEYPGGSRGAAHNFANDTAANTARRWLKL